MGRSCSGPLWMLPSKGSSNYEKRFAIQVFVARSPGEGHRY
jgi:hypothetical protein